MDSPNPEGESSNPEQVPSSSEYESSEPEYLPGPPHISLGETNYDPTHLRGLSDLEKFKTERSINGRLRSTYLKAVKRCLKNYNDEEVVDHDDFEPIVASNKRYIHSKNRLNRLYDQLSPEDKQTITALSAVEKDTKTSIPERPCYNMMIRAF